MSKKQIAETKTPEQAAVAYVKPGECPANMSTLDYLSAWRAAVKLLAAIDAGYLVEYLERSDTPYALIAKTAEQVAQGTAALAYVNGLVEAEVERLYQEGREARNEFDIVLAEVRG